MTSEGLGEMFEGDSADTWAKKRVDGGLSGGLSVRKPGSEDPHRRQRTFIFFRRVCRRVQIFCMGS